MEDEKLDLSNQLLNQLLAPIDQGLDSLDKISQNSELCTLLYQLADNKELLFSNIETNLELRTKIQEALNSILSEKLVFYDLDISRIKGQYNPNTIAKILYDLNSIVFFPTKDENTFLFACNAKAIQKHEKYLLQHSKTQELKIINILKQSANQLDLLDVLLLFQNILNNKILADRLPDIQSKIILQYLISDISQYSDIDACDAQIIKQYFSLLFNNTKPSNSSEKQIRLFNDAISNIWMVDTTFKNKINQTLSFGVVNQSKTNVKILLQDGTITNLFDTQLPCNTIMHGINIEKIKRSGPIDLSNLNIEGDFSCKQIKNIIIFPHQINGVLDCSYCTQQILENNPIPIGTQTLKAESTIKTFNTLLNMTLPKSLTTIIVSDSLINNILKNDTELQYAQQLLKKHPKISIIGKNKNLQTLLITTVLKDPQPFKVTLTPSSTIESTLPIKTDKYLSHKDLLNIFKQDPELISVLSEEELDRLIPIAIRYTGIKKHYLLNQDKNTIRCIENQEPNIIMIKNTILELYQKSKNNENTQTVKPANPTSEQARSEQKKDELNKIDFDIFIPKNVWSDIQKSVGNKTNELINILSQTILINMDVSKQKLQGTVQYINNDGNIAGIPQIHKKVGCCLTQSIDSHHTKDRKRIVWSMNPNDKILIATAFFQQHDRKCSLAYKQACDNATKMCFTTGESVSKQTIQDNKEQYIDAKQKLTELVNPLRAYATTKQKTM